MSWGYHAREHALREQSVRRNFDRFFGYNRLPLPAYVPIRYR